MPGQIRILHTLLCIGTGFDPATVEDGSGGFVLSNLRARLRLFGGRTEIDTTPGVSTGVTLVVPVEHVPLDPEEASAA